jgi:tetraacyldisaccharide 4'-kinase
VQANSLASEVGDEPLALVKATGLPMVVGRNRVLAVNYLLQQHPNLSLILSDDGLQHYAMDRALELVVIDQTRRFGNGYLLPMGPLREPISRLKRVDAVIIKQTSTRLDSIEECPPDCPVFRMFGTLSTAYPLSHTNQRIALSHLADQLKHQSVIALAGIAQPALFFQMLAAHCPALGFMPYPLADHHAFDVSDFDDLTADVFLCTEKDAVKLALMPDFIRQKIWVIPLNTRVEPPILPWLQQQLRQQEQAQTPSV